MHAESLKDVAGVPATFAAEAASTCAGSQAASCPCTPASQLPRQLPCQLPHSAAGGPTSGLIHQLHAGYGQVPFPHGTQPLQQGMRLNGNSATHGAQQSPAMRQLPLQPQCPEDCAPQPCAPATATQIGVMQPVQHGVQSCEQLSSPMDPPPLLPNSGPSMQPSFTSASHQMDPRAAVQLHPEMPTHACQQPSPHSTCCSQHCSPAAQPPLLPSTSPHMQRSGMASQEDPGEPRASLPPALQPHHASRQQSLEEPVEPHITLPPFAQPHYASRQQSHELHGQSSSQPGLAQFPPARLQPPCRLPQHDPQQVPQQSQHQTSHVPGALPPAAVQQRISNTAADQPALQTSADHIRPNKALPTWPPQEQAHSIWPAHGGHNMAHMHQNHLSAEQTGAGTAPGSFCGADPSTQVESHPNESGTFQSAQMRNAARRPHGEGFDSAFEPTARAGRTTEQNGAHGERCNQADRVEQGPCLLPGCVDSSENLQEPPLSSAGAVGAAAGKGRIIRFDPTIGPHGAFCYEEPHSPVRVAPLHAGSDSKCSSGNHNPRDAASRPSARSQTSPGLGKPATGCERNHQHATHAAPGRSPRHHDLPPGHANMPSGGRKGPEDQSGHAASSQMHAASGPQPQSRDGAAPWHGSPPCDPHRGTPQHPGSGSHAGHLQLKHEAADVHFARHGSAFHLQQMAQIPCNERSGEAIPNGQDINEDVRSAYGYDRRESGSRSWNPQREAAPRLDPRESWHKSHAEAHQQASSGRQATDASDVVSGPMGQRQALSGRPLRHEHAANRSEAAGTASGRHAVTPWRRPDGQASKGTGYGPDSRIQFMPTQHVHCSVCKHMSIWRGRLLQDMAWQAISRKRTHSDMLYAE